MVIRISWIENGQRHSSWRDEPVLAQRLVVELQERGISPTVNRFTKAEYEQLKKDALSNIGEDE